VPCIKSATLLARARWRQLFVDFKKTKYFEQTLHTVPVIVKRCCPIWAISTSILNNLLYIVELDFCPQYALNIRSLTLRQ
jgi:hypothetical protein